jgi:hypothetical protein
LDKVGKVVRWRVVNEDDNELNSCELVCLFILKFINLTYLLIKYKILSKEDLEYLQEYLEEHNLTRLWLSE